MANAYTLVEITLDEILTWLDEESAKARREALRIGCPTCAAIVGQRDEVTGAEISEWEHAGPCGAPCAGPRLTRMRRRRKATDHLHTKQACPRCMPKPCPACKGARVVEVDVNEPRSMCKVGIDGIWIACCERCQGKGTVPGLEAD